MTRKQKLHTCCLLDMVCSLCFSKEDFGNIQGIGKKFRRECLTAILVFNHLLQKLIKSIRSDVCQLEDATKNRFVPPCFVKDGERFIENYRVRAIEVGLTIVQT